MRVYIEVTEAQHAQLKELAGLVPVSRWIRSQLFPVDDAQRAKDLIPLLNHPDILKALVTGESPKEDLSTTIYPSPRRIPSP